MTSLETASRRSPRSGDAGSPASSADVRPPVLRVTRYDRVLSFLIALVVGLSLSVVSLSAVYLAHRPPPTDEPAPIELVEIAGGVADGAIDETLRVDSPEDVAQDPSVEENPAEQNEIQEVLENVVELSDLASQHLQQQFEFDAENAGRQGSATGTGRRGLGEGPGVSGLPREKRWFISFSDRATRDEYARQLDFFGIELGALLSGKIVYVSRLSAAEPQVRSATTGKGEDRLYMNWQGGTRRVADVQLFQKAGIDVGNGLIFHFYPPPTEAALARLEREYANRSADEIRRTYFIVRPAETRGEYEFVVTRQSYFH